MRAQHWSLLVAGWHPASPALTSFGTDSHTGPAHCTQLCHGSSHLQAVMGVPGLRAAGGSFCPLGYFSHRRPSVLPHSCPQVYHESLSLTSQYFSFQALGQPAKATLHPRLYLRAAHHSHIGTCGTGCKPGSLHTDILAGKTWGGHVSFTLGDMAQTTEALRHP